jgi:hypothetical protein
VTVAASIDGGAPESGSVTVNGDATTLRPAVTQEQLDRGVTVTVTADPDGVVTETDETDNSIALTAAGDRQFAC